MSNREKSRSPRAPIYPPHFLDLDYLFEHPARTIRLKKQGELSAKDVERKEQGDFARGDISSQQRDFNDFRSFFASQKSNTSPTQKLLTTIGSHTIDLIGPAGDECIPGEIDQEGEKKVTATGQLLDGRDYRVRTFLVPKRGQTLFMLARECARLLGYQDSYRLFNNNRSLFRIITTPAEKDDLIFQEILPFSYRSRQVAIVTARSMFRQFGSRVIVNGRRVRDDYWENKARKQGFTEEDLAGEWIPGTVRAKNAASISKRSKSKNVSSSMDHHEDIVFANRPWDTNRRVAPSDLIRRDRFTSVDGLEASSRSIFAPSDWIQGSRRPVESNTSERFRDNYQHQKAFWSQGPGQPSNTILHVGISQSAGSHEQDSHIPAPSLDATMDRGLKHSTSKEKTQKALSPRTSTVHRVPIPVLSRSTDFDTEDLKLLPETKELMMIREKVTEEQVPHAEIVSGKITSANFRGVQPRAFEAETQPRIKSFRSGFSFSEIEIPKARSSSNNGPPLSYTEMTTLSHESDDETEYSTDDMSESLCSPKQSSVQQTWLSENQLKPILSSIRRGIIDRLMEAFWVTFNDHADTQGSSHAPQDTRDEIDGHVSSSRVETNSASRSLESASEVGRGKQKRRNHGDDDDEGDPDNRHPKKPKGFLLPPDDATGKQKFACPYRKNQPHKYRSNTRQWRSCALTPLDTVARVKGHLYRHHMIHLCQRYKEVFANEEAVKLHLTRVQGCELRDVPVGDGVTNEMVGQLKSKRKSHRGETEEDRWQKIYALLFPGASPPSPYFEILDDSSELEEYSEYCRRELPLVVRAAIEEIARSEVEPLEERLMGQLDNIIRRAQDRVFANYRSAVADCVAGSSGMGDHQQSNAAPLSTSVALQSGQSKGSLSTASPAVEQTMSHIQAQADETSSDPSISSNHSSTTDNLLPRLSHESNEDDFEDFIHVPRALGMPQIQDSGAMQLEMEWLNADESFLYPGNLDLDKAYAGDFQGNHFGIAGSHWPPLPP